MALGSNDLSTLPLKETKSIDPIPGAVVVVQCSVPFKVVEAQKRVRNENVTRIKQTIKSKLPQQIPFRTPRPLIHGNGRKNPSSGKLLHESCRKGCLKICVNLGYCYGNKGGWIIFLRNYIRRLQICR